MYKLQNQYVILYTYTDLKFVGDNNNMGTGHLGCQFEHYLLYFSLSTFKI